MRKKHSFNSLFSLSFFYRFIVYFVIFEINFIVTFLWYFNNCYMNFLKVLFSLIHKLFFMLSSSILFSSIRFAHFFSYYLKLSAKCIWLFQKWIRIIFIIYFGRYIRRPVLFEPLALSTIIILWFIRYCLFSYFNIWLIFLQPFSAVYFIHHNLSGTLDFYRFKRNRVYRWWTPVRKCWVHEKMPDGM